MILPHNTGGSVIISQSTVVPNGNSLRFTPGQSFMGLHHKMQKITRKGEYYLVQRPQATEKNIRRLMHLKPRDIEHWHMQRDLCEFCLTEQRVEGDLNETELWELLRNFRTKYRQYMQPLIRELWHPKKALRKSRPRAFLFDWVFRCYHSDYVQQRIKISSEEVAALTIEAGSANTNNDENYSNFVTAFKNSIPSTTTAEDNPVQPLHHTPSSAQSSTDSSDHEEVQSEEKSWIDLSGEPSDEEEDRPRKMVKLSIPSKPSSTKGAIISASAEMMKSPKLTPDQTKSIQVNEGLSVPSDLASTAKSSLVQPKPTSPAPQQIDLPKPTPVQTQPISVKKQLSVKPETSRLPNPPIQPDQPSRQAAPVSVMKSSESPAPIPAQSEPVSKPTSTRLNWRTTILCFKAMNFEARDVRVSLRKFLHDDNGPAGDIDPYILKYEDLEKYLRTTAMGKLLNDGEVYARLMGDISVPAILDEGELSVMFMKWEYLEPGQERHDKIVIELWKSIETFS